MKMLSLILVAVLAVTLTGCMSDKEFMLRKEDLQAKQAWPATYQPIAIKGPLTLDKDSTLTVTVPNQPYVQASIPDGQAIQATVVKDVVHTGAILGGAMYGINKANGSSSTTINNAAASK